MQAPFPPTIAKIKENSASPATWNSLQYCKSAELLASAYFLMGNQTLCFKQTELLEENT